MLVATMLATLALPQSAAARNLPNQTDLPNLPTEVGVSTYHLEMDGNAKDGPPDEDCDSTPPDATPYNPCTDVGTSPSGHQNYNYKTGEDWETLNAAHGKDAYNNRPPFPAEPDPYTGAAALREFVPDSPRINTQFPGVYIDNKNDLTAYRGGDCKDVEDLSTCVNAAKGFPNKDDIENAYAAVFLNQVARPIWIGLEPGPDPVAGTPICKPYAGGGTNPNHPTGPYANCEWHEVGDVLLYMGLDLAVGNGSASLGAWLMDRSIPAPADGQTFGSLGFTRQDGDLAIIANFHDGGRTYEMSTYRYRGEDCQAKVDNEQGLGVVTCEGPLEPLTRGEEGSLCTECFPQCNGLSCAISNTGELKQGNTVLDEGVGPVWAPWPYVPAPSEAGKTPAGYFPTTTMFEGFVNLTALYRIIGEEMGCFSDFIYETRASHSIDAVLHDWVAGELPLCGLEIDKSGDMVSKVGDEVTYSYVITNTGVVPLDLVWVADYLKGSEPADYQELDDPPSTGEHLGDITETFVIPACGETLAAGSQCTFNVPRDVLGTDADPMENTTIALYSFGDARVSAEESHAVYLFDPKVKVTKAVTTAQVGSAGEVNWAQDSVNVPEGHTVYYHYKIENLTTSATLPTTIDEGDGTSVTIGFPELVIDTDDDPDGIYDDVATLDSHVPPECAKLTKDGSCTIINVDHVAAATAGDRITNDVDVYYNPQVSVITCRDTPRGQVCSDPTARQSFSNNVDADDEAYVNLFRPKVEVTKVADSDLTKYKDTNGWTGTDDVKYTFTITNQSESDSIVAAEIPDLLLRSVNDVYDYPSNGAFLGDLSSNAAGATPTCSTLATNASCTFDVTHTVDADDKAKWVAAGADSLDNKVTAVYYPQGFGSATVTAYDATDTDIEDVPWFDPEYSIAGVCNEAGTPVTVGDVASFQFTFTNSSSANTPTINLETTHVNSFQVVTGATLSIPGSLPAPVGSVVEGVDHTVTDADWAALPFKSGSTEIKQLTYEVDVTYKVADYNNAKRVNATATCDVKLPEPGNIIIVKNTIGGTGVFDYTTTSPTDGKSGIAPSFSLDTTGENPKSISYLDIPTTWNTYRQFTVQEDLGNLPGLSSFTSLVCEDAGDARSVDNSTPHSPTAATSGLGTIFLEEAETVTCTYVNSFPTEGCTPGFWQGGNGSQLWNEPSDPQWPDRTGQGGTLHNPYSHGDLFCAFAAFDCEGPQLTSVTMLDLVGTGGGSSPQRKAARDVVAAYLNASWGMNFGLTPGQVADMWNAAVNGTGYGGNASWNYSDVHSVLSAANGGPNRSCPIP
jgi:hypothetical protein